MIAQITKTPGFLTFYRVRKLLNCCIFDRGKKVYFRRLSSERTETMLREDSVMGKSSQEAEPDPFSERAWKHLPWGTSGCTVPTVLFWNQSV